MPKLRILDRATPLPRPPTPVPQALPPLIPRDLRDSPQAPSAPLPPMHIVLHGALPLPQGRRQGGCSGRRRSIQAALQQQFLKTATNSNMREFVLVPKDDFMTTSQLHQNTVQHWFLSPPNLQPFPPPHALYPHLHLQLPDLTTDQSKLHDSLQRPLFRLRDKLVASENHKGLMAEPMSTLTEATRSPLLRSLIKEPLKQASGFSWLNFDIGNQEVPPQLLVATTSTTPLYNITPKDAKTLKPMSPAADESKEDDDDYEEIDV